MKNVYFLSDAHLGSRAIEHGRTQERRLVNFLDSIKHKAAAVYLLGDMFDFWYEFRLVVPKGYTRFLGKISELTDMVPPNRSIMVLQIDNPSPVPCAKLFTFTKRSKTFDSLSASMPIPVSLTWNSIPSPLRRYP